MDCARLSLLVCVCYLGTALGGLTNVALNKPAAISSYTYFATPKNAVDGKKDPRRSSDTYDDGPFPWYRVDLQDNYTIEAVVITHRADCCAWKLSNFYIYVTDAPFVYKKQKPSDAQICAHREKPLYLSATVRLDCNQPVTGRYVTLVIDTGNRTDGEISIAELEALAQVEGVPGYDWTNVALNKPVSQISYDPEHLVPQYLVDGNKATDSIYCVKTAGRQDSPWLRIDLQFRHVVKGVQLTYKGDCCVLDLKNFAVYVTDYELEPSAGIPPNTERCFRHEDYFYLGATARYDCYEQVIGRYVTLVQLRTLKPLQMCEMEVIGAPVGRGLTNVALNKPATMSSYNETAPPENAVDGLKNTRPYGNCSHSKFEPFPWFRVDLEAHHEIQAVVVTNRGSCCAKYLSNFYVYVTDDPFDYKTQKPSNDQLCASRYTAVYLGATLRLDCIRPVTGRYVTLVINSLKRRGVYLGICEFEALAQVEGVPGYDWTNVALNKPVTQSSYHVKLGAPQNLVDGNKATHIDYCMHTAGDENNPWVRIDLQSEHTVRGIVLTNRGDCCGTSLENFAVYVTELPLSMAKPLPTSDRCFVRRKYFDLGETTRFDCIKLLTGRYVTLVQYTKSKPIHICEMEVLGVSLAGPPEIDWFDSACSYESDCMEDNATCSKGKCTCQLGYFYSVASKTCVPENTIRTDDVSAHWQIIRAAIHRSSPSQIPDRCLKAYAQSPDIGKVLKCLRL